MSSDDRKEAKTELLRQFGDVWFETKKKLDELGEFLQWAKFQDWREEDDPDHGLYEAANSILADGDSFTRKVERLRERVERATVFFLDWSGSMSDAQMDKGYALIKERMGRLTYAGAIGFDAKAAVLCDILPGHQAAHYIRDPYEVRRMTNGVNGGGGTDVHAAIDLCDKPRLGGAVDSFAGFRAPVRKVLVTDGQLPDEQKALFDEIIVIPYEDVKPKVDVAPV